MALPTSGRMLAMLGGEKASGFNSAKKAKQVYPSTLDGAPRFEFDDSKARFTAPKVLPALKPNVTVVGRLEEVLDHPVLYTQYPHLRSLPVAINQNYSKPGSPQATFNGGSIHVAPGMLQSRNILPLILHEVQHAIQFTEGWHPGTRNSKYGTSQYRANPKEKEAYDTQARYRLGTSQRLKSPSKLLKVPMKKK